MCRFIAYLGRPIIVDELLLKPRNSLVHQSYDAEEMCQTVNGDGFGLGWYVHDISEIPGLFRSISPAWNNYNLLYNAPLIRTECMFAHVRAASEGAISEANSHPFHYKQFLMMHNGIVPGFPTIKRRLLGLLNDEMFLWIKGQTDSEHIFALLMQYLNDYKAANGTVSVENVRQGFQKTFDVIQELKQAAGIGDEVSTFNMMITDGYRICGTRFSSDPERETRTLYYAAGSRFSCENGVSNMVQDQSDDRAVVIVSEKLNDHREEWTSIPPNHFISVESNMNIKLLPLNCH
ncbi:MAG: class II glutamine amidotransferase [Gammaproteobacteria bacterium]|nr:class II glutamine amidotransferase [Gammaproteobacteria bacterium]